MQTITLLSIDVSNNMVLYIKTGLEYSHRVLFDLPVHIYFNLEKIEIWLHGNVLQIH